MPHARDLQSDQMPRGCPGGGWAILIGFRTTGACLAPERVAFVLGTSLLVEAIQYGG